ncbi:MAG TPA: hypothetical protein VM580_07205 [Labilithrix sp.]|nr:hypothetical protein [Labilithrix sp.]
MTDKTKIGIHELSYKAETGFLIYVQNGPLLDAEAPLLREAILRYAADYFQRSRASHCSTVGTGSGQRAMHAQRWRADGPIPSRHMS